MGEEGGQCTGCGCEKEKVDGIVAELKKRQAFRGDRAKVRMAESTLSSIQELNSKVGETCVMFVICLFPYTFTDFDEWDFLVEGRFDHGSSEHYSP